MGKNRFGYISLAFILMCLLPLIKLSAERVDLDISYKGCPDFYTAFEAIYVQDHGKIVVILNDGSQWIVRDKNATEMFHKISSTWQVGDDIRIGTRTPKEFAGHYILKNARNQCLCFADLDVICIDPTKANYIEKIDENGYAIFDSNGAEWAIGFWGSLDTYKWRKGDRLIINKSYFGDTEDYLLINADKGSNAWGSRIFWR